MKTLAVKKIATVSLTTLALLGATATTAVADEKEKCYGVVKAGHNDCATKTSSCVGTSRMDGQKDAFVAIPKGLCGKLAGGSLTSS